MSMPVLLGNSYRVLSRIGAGGGGTVYKAWHSRLRKYVVVKEHSSRLSDCARVHRNEVESLKDVRSPYLPQVYDFVTESNSAFSVIEYIEGESFEELLAGGRRFTQLEVAKWYGQLASALDTLHKQKICHRDIKPANIMLTPGGDACLIDFNSALVAGSPSRFVSRSQGYASPEQYEMYERLKRRTMTIDNGGNAVDSGRNSVDSGQLTVDSCLEYQGRGIVLENIDSDTALGAKDGELVDDNKTELSCTSYPFIAHDVSLYRNPDLRILNPEFRSANSLTASAIDWVRSDIYSLGATMYHILAGIRPQARAHEVVPLSKLGGYDPGLSRIIEKSMQPNPARRFASANEIIDALRRLKQRGKTSGINLSPLRTLLFIAATTIVCTTTATIIAYRHLVQLGIRN